MAAATPVRKQGPRSDPRPRTHDGAANRSRVRNKDPKRYYGLVGPNFAGEYKARGWRVEVAEKGGVEVIGSSSREGDEITFNDLFLMSISLEDKELLDMFGDEPGEPGGWALADQIEAKIIDKRGMQADLMRGIKGARGYVGVSSEVQPMMPDKGPLGPYTE